MNRFQKGHIPWNKNKRMEYKHGMLGKKQIEEARAKMSKAKIGYSVTEETKQKISKALKGRPTWNKDKHFVSKGSFRKGMTPWNKGKMGLREEKNPNWKENVSYIGIHAWIKRRRGRPSFCEHCKTTVKRQYHWANKSGEYKRNLDDWIRLCVPCHAKYDSKSQKMSAIRRKQIYG